MGMFDAIHCLLGPRSEILAAPDTLLVILEANSLNDTDEDRE